MPELRLAGCRSRPLIGYLKALGLLRIVSEQADPTARGRWNGDTFELRCALDEEQLAAFLLDGYAPSPAVSPWNGGSGFHPNDRKDALLALEHATAPRFAAYRAAIHAARAVLESHKIADKPKPDQKLPLIRALRRVLPDAALPWLDAAIVVTGERVAYPPLLGSGGNDGRYDFSNNYAQAVVRCLDPDAREESAAALAAALHGGATELQRKLSLGHLNRDASPTNSPYGEADSLGNPWDLILAVEGILLLVAGAARRHEAATGGALVAPFTVYSTAAGYGSTVGGESGRAEVWLPLWSGRASLAEIAVLVRESRAQVGRGNSRRGVRTGLDFARAAGALGVARGIAAFERYALLERAGQATLAVPAGRVSVAERPSAAAIQSIDRWLDAALRFGASEHCPNAIRFAVRRLERASFRLASRSAAEDACATLEAIGAVEHAFARSRTAIEAGLHPLRGAPAADWVKAADDGTAEFAVAAALASLRDDRVRRSPPLRDYLNGTHRNGTAFDAERRDAVVGSSLIGLLAAIHARRHLDAARPRAGEADDDRSSAPNEPGQDEHSGAINAGLAFDRGTWCEPRVATALVAGELDEDRILRLLRGLALLDYTKGAPTPKPVAEGERAVPIFEVLALAWMGVPPPQDYGRERDELGPRPGWAARLAAGAIAPVLADALRRLQMAGLPPILSDTDLLTGVPPRAQLGPRLSAALLLRLRPADLKRIAKRLTIPQKYPDDKPDQRKEAA